MTRSELYELVWKEPVSHVAKRFGISDVALRKTCVKHHIPTPPLGYWAKLAFGKKVSQPALPTQRNGENEHIQLTVRQPKELPTSISAVLDAAEQQELMPERKIVVPKVRPSELHPLASKIEKTIRKCKTNDDGFLFWGEKEEGGIAIGPNSLERVTILLDSLRHQSLLKPTFRASCGHWAPRNPRAPCTGPLRETNKRAIIRRRFYT